MSTSSEQKPQTSVPGGNQSPREGVFNDGLELIEDKISEIQEILFNYAEEQGDSKRLEISRRLVSTLSRHSSSEERYLYPLIRDRVRGGHYYHARLIMDDQIFKSILGFLDRHDPSDSAEWSVYNVTVEKLRVVLHEHNEMKSKLISELRNILSDQELKDLHKNYSWGIDHAPSRPHQSGPSGPIAAKLIHPIEGIYDRAADAVTRRSSTT